MPDQTMEKLNHISYLVENLTSDRNRLLKAVADLQVQRDDLLLTTARYRSEIQEGQNVQRESLLREGRLCEALRAFVTWNHRQGMSGESGLRELSRALENAEKLLKGESDASKA